MDVVKYNAALSSSAKGSAWPEALRLFAALPEAKLQATEVSYTAALTACARGDCWQQALELLAEVDHVRLQNNIITVGAAMGALGPRQWLLALCLLGDLPQRNLCPNVVVVSAAITACAGHWLQALALLQELHPLRLQPNVITYNAAISACGSSEQWQEALQLLSELLVDELRPTAVTYSTCISACQGRWREALAILGLMAEETLEANIVALGAATAALARAGEWQRAAYLLAGFDEVHLAPSLVVFSSTIKACEMAVCWQQALGLFRELCRRRLEADSIAYSTTLHIVTAGDWPHAQALLAEWPPEAVGCRVALGAGERSRLWPAALALSGDVAAFHTASRACRDGKQWSAALGVLVRIPEVALQPTVISLNSALAAYEQTAQWPRACELLRGCRPIVDRISYNTVLSCLEKARQWLLALSCIDIFAIQRLAADAVTCNSAASACEKAVEWEFAHQLLLHARHGSIETDAIAFNALLSAVEKAGDRQGSISSSFLAVPGWQWRCSTSLLADLRHDALRGSAVTYGSIMITCGRSLQWQQAQSLLQRMQLQPADVMTCNALMGTYQKSAEWRQTLAFFTSLRDADCMMDAWSFSTASAACEAGGCLGTQLDILEEAEATAVGCFDPLGGEKSSHLHFS